LSNINESATVHVLQIFFFEKQGRSQGRPATSGSPAAAGTPVKAINVEARGCTPSIEPLELLVR
jgi:hypothetical protein